MVRQEQQPPAPPGETSGGVRGYQNLAAQRSGFGVVSQTPKDGAFLIRHWGLRGSEEFPKGGLHISEEGPSLSCTDDSGFSEGPGELGPRTLRWARNEICSDGANQH